MIRRGRKEVKVDLERWLDTLPGIKPGSFFSCFLEKQVFLSRALRSEDGTLPLSVFHTDGSGKLSGRLYVTLQVIFQRAALSRAGSVEADRTDISARSWERNLEGRTGCAPQTPPPPPVSLTPFPRRPQRNRFAMPRARCHAGRQFFGGSSSTPDSAAG